MIPRHKERTIINFVQSKSDIEISTWNSYYKKGSLLRSFLCLPHLDARIGSATRLVFSRTCSTSWQKQNICLTLCFPFELLLQLRNFSVNVLAARQQLLKTVILVLELVLC